MAGLRGVTIALVAIVLVLAMFEDVESAPVDSSAGPFEMNDGRIVREVKTNGHKGGGGGRREGHGSGHRKMGRR